MVITISHAGYIKRTSVSTYRRQRRGGRGLNGQRPQGRGLHRAPVHRRRRTTTCSFFTDDGRCFWLKVHEIPQAGRAAKGKPIVNLINVSPDTQVTAIVPVREFPDDQFLLFATKQGTVKKTALSQYSNSAHERHQGDQDRAGRRADRRAGHDRHERHRARHAARPVDPVPRAGRARDGARHDRREGHRARRARCSWSAWSCIKREATLLVVTEKGHGQVLADRRVPRAEPRRQGHHHRQPHRQDGRRRVDQGSAAGRRADADHETGDRDPHAREGHSRGRPQHPGREAREPRDRTTSSWTSPASSRRTRPRRETRARSLWWWTARSSEKL